MSVTHYGYAGVAITLLPNQPTRERTGETWEYKWRGWCATSLAHDGLGGLIPAAGTAMSSAPTSSSLPDAASLLLSHVSVSPTEAPERSEVELTYSYEGRPVPPWGAPADTEEKRCEAIMVDVPVSVAYDDGGDWQADAIKIAEAGGKTIKVPGLKYTYSKYVNSFTWSEANLIAVSGIAIGEAGSPTGLTLPTANKWRLVGKHIEQTGGGQAKVGEEWEYSTLGFGA